MTRAFRTGILPDSTLIARKLGSTHRILCASPDYLAPRGDPVASADLARHHCVIAGPFKFQSFGQICHECVDFSAAKFHAA